MPKAKELPPFCRADFFDRFQEGKSVLHLEFVGEQPVWTSPDDRGGKRKEFVPLETLGVYAGREGEAIKVDPVLKAVQAIRAIDIRGLKEIAPGGISAIVSDLQEAAALLGDEDESIDEIHRQVRFLNAVREIVARRSLLLPHLRLPQ